MIKIAPSVLAADFSKLGEEISKVEKAGADWLHLDVMDGAFVPNISFGAPVIKSVRKNSTMFFDVHLMINDPIRYINDFASAGADMITIHYESCKDCVMVLKAIHALGKKTGISVKPDTSASVLEPLMPYVDCVLVMTVQPGFGGQSFMTEALDNVKTSYNLIKAGGYNTDIEVDGGINTETAALAAAAGANVFVAGSSVFHAQDASDAINKIRSSAEKAFGKDI